MRTAIYGGTFNPPHRGHERVARLLNETVRPDRILIIPAAIPPLKQVAANSPSPETRMELCHLAFDNVPGAEISAIEIGRDGTSFTVDTLEALRALYPDDSFLLTVGSDQLLQFRKWRRFEDILRMVELVVFSREEGDRPVLEREAESLRREYGASVFVAGSEPLVISSDEIRRAVRGELPAETVNRYLNPAVRDAIRRGGYYENHESG